MSELSADRIVADGTEPTASVPQPSDPQPDPQPDLPRRREHNDGRPARPDQEDLDASRADDVQSSCVPAGNDDDGWQLDEADPSPASTQPRRLGRPMTQLGLIVATCVAGWLIVTQVPPLPRAEQPAPGPVEVRPIAYRDFTDPAGLALAGNAHRAEAALRLVEGSNQSGAVWSAFRVDPARSLNTAFRFSSTGRSGTLMFVLQPKGTDVGSSVSSVLPRLTVEFDPAAPAEDGSPATNRIRADAVTADGTSIELQDAPSDVVFDGAPVNVWVDYLARDQELRVFVSTGNAKPGKPLFTAPVDLSVTMGAQPVFAGFVASTADRAGTHDISAWYLAGTAVAG